MSGSNVWCVTPETEEVELVVGAHRAVLMLKKELSYGEERAIATSGMRAVGGITQTPTRGAADPEIKLDWASQSVARALAWIADWTLTDGKGNKLPIARQTFEAFRPAVMEAIENAISAHIAAQEALRKNGPAGESRPPATSD